MLISNWVIDEDSFGENLPDTWEEDAVRINAAYQEAGIPEYGELTPEQEETRNEVWERYCMGEL